MCCIQRIVSMRMAAKILGAASVAWAAVTVRRFVDPLGAWRGYSSVQVKNWEDLSPNDRLRVFQRWTKMDHNGSGGFTRKDILPLLFWRRKHVQVALQPGTTFSNGYEWTSGDKASSFFVQWSLHANNELKS